MPDKSYHPKPRQKLTPEQPNACAITLLTTFLGRYHSEALIKCGFIL